MKTERRPRTMTVADIYNEMEQYSNGETTLRELLQEPVEHIDRLEQKAIETGEFEDLERWTEKERQWFSDHSGDLYQVEWPSHVTGTPINSDACFKRMQDE